MIDAATDVARRDLREGRGAGYGVGFGFARRIGDHSLDGVRLEYAMTDGEREGTMHVIVAGTAMAVLAGQDPPIRTDADLAAWAQERLYARAGAIRQSDDRFATLLAMSPITLSTLDIS